MIIVDTALSRLLEEKKSIRIGMVGAGFSARHVANQILRSFPAIHLAVIVNRTLAHARDVYQSAGAEHIAKATTVGDIETAVEEKTYCITDDAALLFATSNIDAIIETTGDIDYGAWVALQSIKSGKHTIALNCEMDATVGPILKVYADKRGVIYSNTDGDEPGVARNLSRFVRTIGFQVVAAGNLKGFYDRYRTPHTQRAFATANNQKPKAVTAYADGTKLSMELTVLANASGFGVAKRGMHGPACDDVRNCLEYFPDEAFSPGKPIVDFLIGAAPHTGAFVIGYSERPQISGYMNYLKMGSGPFYVFHTPFHLPQLEIPITVARAVLFSDAAVAPKGPYCDAVTIAKKDLRAGTTLDGLGGFCTYALIDNYDISREENLLPMGLSENCVLTRNISIDTPITYADVELPRDRLIDDLRREMVQYFDF